MNKVLQYQIDHVLPQQAERFGFQLSGPNPGLRTTEHSSWTDTDLTLQETYDRIDYSLKTVNNPKTLRSQKIWQIKNDIASMPLEQQEYMANLGRIVFEALEIHLAADPQDSNKLLGYPSPYGIDFMPGIEELVQISLSKDSAAKLKAIRWGGNLNAIDDVGFNAIPNSDEALCKIAYWTKCLDAASMLNSYSIFSVRIPQENLIAKRRS
jgi:hypothetical protein